MKYQTSRYQNVHSVTQATEKCHSEQSSMPNRSTRSSALNRRPQHLKPQLDFHYSEFRENSKSHAFDPVNLAVVS